MIKPLADIRFIEEEIAQYARDCASTGMFWSHQVGGWVPRLSHAREALAKERAALASLMVWAADWLDTGGSVDLAKVQDRLRNAAVELGGGQP